jgi:hypothetical protein
MKIVDVDLHAKQQSIAALLDTESGEFTEKIIRHEEMLYESFMQA